MKRKDFTKIYTPPSGPPQGAGPSRDIYETMGRENIFRMCEDFYGELEKSSIRPMFSPDMTAASRRLAAFLVGLLGGPPLFHELYGPPQMRARHIPFEIDESARRIWLDCFYRTLEKADEKYTFPREHLSGFIQFLDEFSAWMVNKKDA